MELIKARQDLVIGHVLVIEEDGVAFQYLYGNKILYPTRGRARRRWQIDPNAFHMGLAQTHHHETGEEKEHDVDQRNDFDPGSFVRNR